MIAEIAYYPCSIDSWIDLAQQNAPWTNLLLARADFLALHNLRGFARKTRHTVQFKLLLRTSARIDTLAASGDEFAEHCLGPCAVPHDFSTCLNQRIAASP